MTVVEQQQQIKDPHKALEIRVFTLNIWGIPNISKNRQERVRAIAQQLALAHEPYHFVFLQEVWSKSDYRFLADKLKKVLPYSHYFYSGVNGSGTCTFSCSPIHDVHFHPFTLNGYPHKVTHGDWYGGKGVSLCKTVLQGIPFLLVNAHLHAEYDSDSDEYVHHRVSQAFEVSQVLRFAQPGNSVAIFGGDLNCTVTDVPYRLLIYNTGFVDTFLDCSIKPADGVGATNETPGNSYTSLKALRENPNGNRIDYIFHWTSEQFQVKTLVHDQPFPHRVPQFDFSFSDHEGVRAVLSVRQKPHISDQEDASTNDMCLGRTDSLLDASAVCAQGLRIVAKGQRWYAWCAVTLCIALITLIGSSSVDMPGGGRVLMSLLVTLVTLGLGFCIYMAVVFSSQEHHSVLATKHALDRLLEEVRQKNAKRFEEQRKRALAAQ